MNLLGIDIKPLIAELAKFSQTQAQIIALLKENNHWQQQILAQLGGKIPNQLNSLNSALIEEN